MLDGMRILEGSGVHPAGVSSLWETEPVGIPPGLPVLNAAIHAFTELSPPEVLVVCRQAEAAAGRRRGEREWRSLDLDILLCGSLRLATEDLTLPHPRFHLRRFNLAPLEEIAPGVVHPVLLLTIRELLRRCADPAWARISERDWAAAVQRDRR